MPKAQKKVLRESSFFLLYKGTKREEKAAVCCLMFGIPFYRLVWRLYLQLTKKASGTIV